MQYELRIALRYLRARRKEAFISVTTLFTAIGVTIGVAALIITLSVMGGFQANLRERVLSLTPQIEIQNNGGAMTDYPAVQRRVDNVSGVTGSDPFLIGQAMLSSGRGLSGIVVRGIEPKNPVVRARLGRYLTNGELNNLSSKNSESSRTDNWEIALGSVLAQKLKVKVGDAVRMTAPIVAGGGLSTRTGEFRVGAIFESGVNFIDRDMVFMGLKRAQAFFGRVGQVDGVEAQLKTLDDTQAITAALRKEFGSHYRVRNWIEFNRAASAGFAMLKRVYALVLLLLIGVAAFNLIATLIMVVMEKRKDIAVLMTMGASRAAVRMVFILKGLIIGALGTSGGLILGALGCFALAHYHFIHIPKAIYGVSSLPVVMTPGNFIVVAIASLALCLLATVYPARQASRERPSEVLRS